MIFRSKDIINTIVNDERPPHRLYGRVAVREALAEARDDAIMIAVERSELEGVLQSLMDETPESLRRAEQFARAVGIRLK